MSIQRYCDTCGANIAESVTALHAERTFEHEGSRIFVKAVVTVNVTDICRDCVIDTVLAADTRPREAAS